MVTLTPSSYDEAHSDFRLLVGDKADTEEMISGNENAVWLDKYTQTADNTFFTYYTPNRYESWYRFTADIESTVVTLMTNYSGTRFRIVDIDDTNNIIYDSNNNTDAHRTQYCLYSNAEKARLNLTSGKDYYLIIYAPTAISSETFIEETMNLTVGRAHMAQASATFYSDSTVTARNTSFSPSAVISVDDSVPATAVVDKITFKSATSGVKMSQIRNWRVRAPQESSWRTSQSYYQGISIGFNKDSDNNIAIRGNWLFNFKGSSKTALTFTPGIYIYYYYEIGD